MAGQSYVDKKGLTVKELVSIGVFTALFVVFAMIGGTPFSPNPVLTFYTPLGMSLLCGPMFLLMVAKAPKRWSITILAVIVAVLWYVTGMHWAQALGRALVRRALLMQDDARRSRAGYEHPRRQAKTQDADHSGSAK